MRVQTHAGDISKVKTVEVLFELYHQRNFIWKVYGGVGVICGSAVHCSVLTLVRVLGGC